MSRRDDIAQRVLGRLQQREGAAEPARPRAMNTFIGQVGERMTQGFAARVEELERERQEGFVILILDPKAIRVSDHANRHELSLRSADPDFLALKESLRRAGQIMPVSVRALPARGTHSHELVSGHRRLAAALELDRETPEGFQLRAVLDTAAQEPATLALHMYLENAARKDLSAYELGAMFRNWLSGGVFSEQQEIAEATGLSKPSITKYMQVAALPEPVLSAFGDPRLIAVRWSELIAAAMKENGDAVVAVARKISARTERPPAEVVLRQLTEAGATRKARRVATQTDTVKIDGRTAFAYSLRDGKIAIRFGKHVEPELARELTEEIKELLKSRLRTKFARGTGR